MEYISTRGGVPARNFEQTLLEGLAADGGLYLPRELPRYGREEILSWKDLGYAELSERILRPFVGDCLGEAEFRELLQQGCDAFAVQEVTPLHPLAPGEWMLELFHGPTLSFKDCAMQLLGRLLDAVLAKRERRAVVLGATSGDTGSAAIAACIDSPRIDTVILHPHGRVSEVQRRQMTTVRAPNVHNLAVEGDFDDCQAIVKQCFAAADFLPPGCGLAAVNSINWARIMAQTVYYFAAWLRLGAPATGALYSVPTGNFGDIYAGYLAAQMGLPVHRLVAAVGRNDVLHRFFREGHCSRSEVQPSLAPSIDISVPSNFERLLFDWCGRDPEHLCSLMQNFQQQGVLAPGAPAAPGLRELFDSGAVSDEELCQGIADVYREHECLVDPHTAVGIVAGRRCWAAASEAELPRVFLATAHPGKFSQVLQRAVGFAPPLPPAIEALHELPEQCRVLPPRADAVQEYIEGIAARH